MIRAQSGNLLLQQNSRSGTQITQVLTDLLPHTFRDVKSFLWDSNSMTPGFENLGLRTWPKKTWTPTPTLALLVWHTDCVLEDDLKEILNSSNKQTTWTDDRACLR